jgi:hypothetical protein
MKMVRKLKKKTRERIKKKQEAIEREKRTRRRKEREGEDTLKKRKEKMADMKGKEDRKTIRENKNLKFPCELRATSLRKPICFDYFGMEGINVLFGVTL